MKQLLIQETLLQQKTNRLLNVARTVEVCFFVVKKNCSFSICRMEVVRDATRGAESVERVKGNSQWNRWGMIPV
jgi:hypothetical protein